MVPVLAGILREMITVDSSVAFTYVGALNLYEIIHTLDLKLFNEEYIHLATKSAITLTSGPESPKVYSIDSAPIVLVVSMYLHRM